MGRWLKGKYTPINKEKYIGDIDNITYRSSWERYVCKFLDNNTKVRRWGSEIVVVEYIKPTTNKTHRYYTDFYVEYENVYGRLCKEVWEIKPAKQLKRPSSRSKNRAREEAVLSINLAKWDAAKRWCSRNGIEFKILTEKDFFR